MASPNPGVDTPGSSASGTPEPRILVSLATYNEAGNIAALIAEIHKFVPQADVLVIDDNSPDGTGRDRRGAGSGRPAGKASCTARASSASAPRSSRP